MNFDLKKKFIMTCYFFKESKRRQVNLDQLTSLLDFLKEHQELAKGLTRGRRGKFHTLKIWNLCAKKMNAVKDGAIKDGKGWSKVL